MVDDGFLTYNRQQQKHCCGDFVYQSIRPVSAPSSSNRDGSCEKCTFLWGSRLLIRLLDGQVLFSLCLQRPEATALVGFKLMQKLFICVTGTIPSAESPNTISRSPWLVSCKQDRNILPTSTLLLPCATSRKEMMLLSGRCRAMDSVLAINSSQ